MSKPTVGITPQPRTIPRWGQSTAAVRGNATANLLLLQVNGVGPPLYPEDVGHRVLARAEKQRKGELGTLALGKHAPRTVFKRRAQGLGPSPGSRHSLWCLHSGCQHICTLPPLQLETTISSATPSRGPLEQRACRSAASPVAFAGSRSGTVIWASACEPGGERDPRPADPSPRPCGTTARGTGTTGSGGPVRTHVAAAAAAAAAPGAAPSARPVTAPPRRFGPAPPRRGKQRRTKAPCTKPASLLLVCFLQRGSVTALFVRARRYRSDARRRTESGDGSAERRGLNAGRTGTSPPLSPDLLGGQG